MKLSTTAAAALAAASVVVLLAVGVRASTNNPPPGPTTKTGDGVDLPLKKGVSGHAKSVPSVPVATDAAATVSPGDGTTGLLRDVMGLPKELGPVIGGAIDPATKAKLRAATDEPGRDFPAWIVSRLLGPPPTKAIEEAIALLSAPMLDIDDDELHRLETELVQAGFDCSAKGNCITLRPEQVTMQVIRNLARLYYHAVLDSVHHCALYRLFYIPDEAVVRLRYQLRGASLTSGFRHATISHYAGYEKLANMPGFRREGDVLYLYPDSWIFAHRTPSEPQIKRPAENASGSSATGKPATTTKSNQYAAGGGA